MHIPHFLTDMRIEIGAGVGEAMAFRAWTHWGSIGSESAGTIPVYAVKNSVPILVEIT
jgi:hypothetical protein